MPHSLAILCLLRARLAALGSSALPGRGRPIGCPTIASGARASRLPKPPISPPLTVQEQEEPFPLGLLRHRRLRRGRRALFRHALTTIPWPCHVVCVRVCAETFSRCRCSPSAHCASQSCTCRELQGGRFAPRECKLMWDTAARDTRHGHKIDLSATRAPDRGSGWFNPGFNHPRLVIKHINSCLDAHGYCVAEIS